MRRDGDYARLCTSAAVRLTTGERVRTTLMVTFASSGAVVDVRAPRPPPDQVQAEETAAALLVEAIGGKLRRRPDIGVAELRRRAEVALHLLEQLEEIESQRGAEARALFRDRAA